MMRDECEQKKTVQLSGEDKMLLFCFHSLSAENKKLFIAYMQGFLKTASGVDNE